jgi:hypothetical protein
VLKTSAIGLAGMVFSPRLFSNKREQNSKIVATRAETVMNDCVSLVQVIQKHEKRISGGGAEDTTSRTNRKLDTPETTLHLNAHVVDQEFGDEKVTEGLTDEVVGQESPVLSGLPAMGLWKSVSLPIGLRSEEFAHLVVG